MKITKVYVTVYTQDELGESQRIEMFQDIPAAIGYLQAVGNKVVKTYGGEETEKTVDSVLGVGDEKAGQ